jgi:hypothetical protein
LAQSKARIQISTLRCDRITNLGAKAYSGFSFISYAIILYQIQSQDFTPEAAPKKRRLKFDKFGAAYKQEKI